MWALIEHTIPEYLDDDLHVLPAEGREHWERDDCWCCPKIENHSRRRLIIHNREQ